MNTALLASLFDTTGFPPRWRCGDWSSLLGWTHIASDIAIFSAYTAIPVVLLWFVLRRRDVPFPRVFWLFGLFIFACGTTHLLEAIIFWQPVYRLSGVVKIVTALASWATVAALVPIVPHALRLQSVEQTNASLQREIEQRNNAERLMAQSNEDLRAFHAVAVDREMRIVELKREVNAWAAKCDAEPVYDLQFAATDDSPTEAPGTE